MLRNTSSSCVSDQIQSKIAISQKVIRPKIRSLLSQLDASQETIDAFKRGFCNGLAALALYAFYLETLNQENPTLNAPDDWVWLKRTLERISTWDENLYSFYQDELHDVLHLISLMEYFQHTSTYLAHSQGNLHEILEDNVNRKPKQEYTISGLFTRNDFTKKILLQIADNLEQTSLLDIILKYEKRMILISRGGHTLGLFRAGQRLSFYNANSARKDFNTENLDGLLKTMFSAYRFDPDTPSPFGFRIYTFDQQLKAYPTQAELLEKLNSPDKTAKYFAIHLAVRIGSKECVKYYLRNRDNLEKKSRSKRTPLYIAASKGYLAIVITLMKQGADIVKKCRHKSSPLSIAANKGRVNIVKTMLEAENNSTSANLLTALKHFRTDNQRFMLLNQLDDKKLLEMSNHMKIEKLFKRFKGEGQDSIYKERVLNFFHTKPEPTESPIAHPETEIPVKTCMV